MAKILVADDNSNIQKMVVLALKDEGIDVVAVGNGEAAVRKISDIKPDLVLADVFMPVRNGYEVCKYVKDDSALSHIPVILLVGAFDPLDEQEAQRVGADGVLKKPFVPPDPLISMVKSALTRAGVSLSNEPEPVAVKEEPAAFRPLALQMPPAPIPSFEEPTIEDIPARPAPVNIDRNAQPLAFGSLLDAPAAEEEDASTLVAPVRMERDWKSPDEEEDKDIAEEEVEEPSGGWRPGGGDLDDDIPAGKKDWREVAFANIPETPARSAYSAVEEAPVAAEVAGNGIPGAYMAEATWSVAQDKSAPAEAPQPNTIESTAEETIPAPAAIAMPDMISVQESVAVSEPIPAPVPAPEVATPTNSSWMSVAPSPWDAEAAKASKLAATWDTSVAVATEQAAAPSAYSSAPLMEEPETQSVEDTVASLPPAAQEAIREEAAEVVEETATVAAPAAPEPVVAPEMNVEDMVAKVIAKLDPAVLQALTKELIKPVIESVVREELRKK